MLVCPADHGTLVRRRETKFGMGQKEKKFWEEDSVYVGSKTLSHCTFLICYSTRHLFFPL